jgi:hypothetical protein
VVIGAALVIVGLARMKRLFRRSRR